MMIKFIYLSIENDASDHWNYCQNHKIPFVRVKRINKTYYEVFYDITNFKVNHEEISENIKNIFVSYSEFFCLPFYEIDSYLDQLYFFRFPVKEGHQDIICTQLFEFLLKRIK